MRIALTLLVALALTGCAVQGRNFAPYSCTSVACQAAADTADTTDQSTGGN